MLIRMKLNKQCKDDNIYKNLSSQKLSFKGSSQEISDGDIIKQIINP